jgi:hypothetical protein
MNLVDLTTDEFENLIRGAVRKELHDAGLRIDGDHQDAAREDFRFLRKLRVSFESTSSRVGMTIVLIIAGALLTALWSGVTSAFRQ